MANHMHFIWQIQDGFELSNIQMRFLKFTAQQFKFRLTDTNDTMLAKFLVNTTDRHYQFWERNSLSINLWSPAVFDQNWITFIIIHYRKSGVWQNIRKIINIHPQGFTKPVLTISAFLHIMLINELGFVGDNTDKGGGGERMSECKFSIVATG